MSPYKDSGPRHCDNCALWITWPWGPPSWKLPCGSFLNIVTGQIAQLLPAVVSPLHSLGTRLCKTLPVSAALKLIHHTFQRIQVSLCSQVPQMPPCHFTLHPPTQTWLPCTCSCQVCGGKLIIQLCCKCRLGILVLLIQSFCLLLCVG